MTKCKGCDYEVEPGNTRLGLCVFCLEARDKFIAAALGGLQSDPDAHESQEYYERIARQCAEWAVMLADETMKARKG